MHIIFGSNNRWAQLELLKWLGINSMEEAQEMNNGIVLHFRNPEHSGTYDDKQAHRELITQLGEDAAVNIVLLACHRKTGVFYYNYFFYNKIFCFVATNISDNGSMYPSIHPSTIFY